MLAADGNSSDHEKRIRKFEAARKDVEDALIVMAHLETKASARVKEHADFLAEHDNGSNNRRSARPCWTHAWTSSFPLLAN